MDDSQTGSDFQCLREIIGSGRFIEVTGATRQGFPDGEADNHDVRVELDKKRSRET